MQSHRLAHMAGEWEVYKQIICLLHVDVVFLLVLLMVSSHACRPGAQSSCLVGDHLKRG